MAEKITDILIVGVGGQGTLLASRVLAQAAIQLNYDVKVSEVHGMAQRGGSVVSQVRFGKKVFSPIIEKGKADVVLAFEKLEAARYLEYLRDGGLMIINDQRIDPLPVMSGESRYPEGLETKIAAIVPRTVVVDATGIAERCGEARAANMVLIGILGKALGFSHFVLEDAVRQVLPARAVEVNLQAMEEGRNYLAGRSI